MPTRHRACPLLANVRRRRSLGPASPSDPNQTFAKPLLVRATLRSRRPNRAPEYVRLEQTGRTTYEEQANKALGSNKLCAAHRGRGTDRRRYRGAVQADRPVGAVRPIRSGAGFHIALVVGLRRKSWPTSGRRGHRRSPATATQHPGVALGRSTRPAVHSVVWGHSSFQSRTEQF